ncbi:molybdopterin molybdotransferase MoeA [Olivibacter sp. SDN3]|uniref:molybdopterin molybdotransferase MoeA n=1 Tax=Olivibacter sp. SDN3 TaxID=2764720 RepID=UPI0016518230|nr:gephyrin-like molybdotransferase Glp [Olivibacter sp. SDN3]QNL47995.1 molybdopterin molybdotransferase MoeA [Olivibacter sp. SDN3]
MISVNEARKILSANVERAEAVTINLQDSLGAVLAENVYAPVDVPFFNNSAMDGYAVDFVEHIKNWEVVKTIQAGDSTETILKQGQAARIFTGAKIPNGANTVIPQEMITVENQSISYDLDKIKKGDHVRLKGSQCQQGDLLLAKGIKLNAPMIGLLASVGLAEVSIYKIPSVTYIVTGNELKEAGTKLEAGEIYNSNGPMLKALLSEVGIHNTSALIAADDQHKLQQVINKALSEVDILILSGGISVGDYDFVKVCMENAGVQELFYKVKQRPGKPIFVGKKERKWIFALPGNPSSVLSCFKQYVKPCLEYLMGADDVWAQDKILPLATDFRKVMGLTFFVKAYENGSNVEILDGQQSFNLQAFGKANCFIELDENKEVIPSGTEVKIFNL